MRAENLFDGLSSAGIHEIRSVLLLDLSFFQSPGKEKRMRLDRFFSWIFPSFNLQVKKRESNFNTAVDINVTQKSVDFYDQS
jgi:hypothetical protein